MSITFIPRARQINGYYNTDTMATFRRIFHGCLYTFFTACPFFIFSQDTLPASEVWTLQSCIDRAMENNIQIKRSGLVSETYAITLKQTKLSVLPGINGSALHSYNFGRRLDPVTNSFSTTQTQSNNFSLSGDMTLFKGFQSRNTIRQYRSEYQAGIEDLENTKKNIVMEVMTAYLQILLNAELLKSAESQLETTTLERDRLRKLVDAGRVVKGDLLDMESQLAQEEYQIVIYSNDLELSRLNLVHLLELDIAAEDLKIEIPLLKEIDESPVTRLASELFEEAVAIQPVIKRALFRLEGAQSALKVAQGGYYPSLSLGSSVSSGFSTAKINILDPNLAVVPFSDQMNENISESVFFSLNIPLFNGMRSKLAVTKVRISLLDAEYQLKVEKKTLREKMERIHTDAKASQQKYNAAARAKEAREEAFNYMKVRFSEGLSTSVEFTDAKNKLSRMESEMISAKFEYLFRLKLIEFYRGNPVSL